MKGTMRIKGLELEIRGEKTYNTSFKLEEYECQFEDQNGSMTEILKNLMKIGILSN